MTSRLCVVAWAVSEKKQLYTTSSYIFDSYSIEGTEIQSSENVKAPNNVDSTSNFVEPAVSTSNYIDEQFFGIDDQWQDKKEKVNMKFEESITLADNSMSDLNYIDKVRQCMWGGGGGH